MRLNDHLVDQLIRVFGLANLEPSCMQTCPLPASNTNHPLGKAVG